MNAMTLALVTAAIAFLKEAIPQVTAAVKRGEVSKEDQEKLRNEYNSLKNKADGQFQGPEWEIANRE